MLRDLILSIATPFANSRNGNSGKLSINQHHSVTELVEDPSGIVASKKHSSLRHRRRSDSSAHIARRKKSNSLPDALESAQIVRRIVKGSVYAKSYPINILVVGAKNVGKSALTVRFITKRFIGEYMSGENQTYNYTSSDEKKQQPIIFLDESSESENDNSRLGLDEQNLAWSDGIMVVYDVGDYSTFTYAKDVIKFMTNKLNSDCYDVTSHQKKNSNENFRNENFSDFKPILLIGNKTDLLKRRSVSDDDIREAAEEFPPWVSCDEVSAAEGYDDVVKSVNELISKIREKRRYESGLSSKTNIRHFVGSVFRHRTNKTTSYGSY